MAQDEFEKKNFERQLGQASTVERHTLGGDLTTQCNEVLKDLGLELKPNEAAEYLGSFAVHAYQTPVLRQMFFLSQTLPQPGCTPLLASKAIADLGNRTKESLGIVAPQKRSGF